MYRVTKTYGHNLGLSACFRQWRASSHCRFLHGYALSFEFIFEAPKLNANNWVIDFGSLKPIKEWLVSTFDHKTLIAHDDPALPLFQDMAREFHKQKPQLIDLRVVEAVGCEAFAKLAFDAAVDLIQKNTPQGGLDNGVYLRSVEAREHGANSATYVNIRNNPLNTNYVGTI